MSRKIFDYEEGDFATLISDTMAIDPNGDLFMCMGENMAMDMETGDLQFRVGVMRKRIDYRMKCSAGKLQCDCLGGVLFRVICCGNHAVGFARVFSCKEDSA